MKAFWICLGIAVVGGGIYLAANHISITVETIDYLAKSVVVSADGRNFPFKYGSPSVGYMLSSDHTLEFVGNQNNLIVVSLKKNGRTIRQEVIRVVQ